MIRNKATWIIVLGCMLLAACAPAEPVRTFTTGEELAYYDFSSPGSFEEGTYADGEVRLQVREGVYRLVVARGDNELWWGQWGESYDNVVIDVDATQQTEREETVYGVMCRARGGVGQRPAAASNTDTEEEIAATPVEDDAAEASEEATAESAEESATTEPETEAAEEEATPDLSLLLEPSVSNTGEVNNGDGYLFLVQGSGRFAIMISTGRNLSPLVDWKDSSAIQRGAGRNNLRAVCVGDYLALYINGQFVGDAIDRTYTRGQVALAAAASSRLGVTVDFDNLRLSEGQAG